MLRSRSFLRSVRDVNMWREKQAGRKQYLALAQKLDPSFVAKGGGRAARVDEAGSADADYVSEANLTGQRSAQRGSGALTE